MKQLAASGILCAAVLSSAPARAQDTSDLAALLGETVSTTASKSAEASTAAPALCVNVTAEDLRRHGIRTLAEAYDFLALGLVSEDSLGDAEVGSRGVLLSHDAGKHILLLIDGHVTNDQRNGASYHTQAAGIPIELIDHIEIMLGPGSVLYGSNAMLGVVNVVTKRAKDFDGIHLLVETTFSPPINAEHQPIGPSLTGDYLSDAGKSVRAGVGLGKTFRLFGHRGEITGEVEYYAFKGPAIGWTPIGDGASNFGPYTPTGSWGGVTRQSYYQQMPSGYLRLEYGDFQLTLHALMMHASAPYGRVGDLLPDFDDPSSYGNRSYGAFDLSWKKPVSSAVSLSARLYGDGSQEYSQIRTAAFLACGTEISGCTHTSEGHGAWLGTEVQTSIRWLADRSMSSMVGVEGRVLRVGFQSGISSYTTGAPLSTSGQYDGTSAAGAVYAQQIYTPTAAVTLNAGARFDFDSHAGERLSPRAATAIEVWHGGTLKAIYSEAFRAPTPEELYLTNRYLVLASPHLLPETVRAAEVLLQQRYKTHRLLFGVFGSWWDNLVFRVNLSRSEFSAAQREGIVDQSAVLVNQFRNVAHLDDYGFNAGYEGTLLNGQLTLAANITSAYARIQSQIVQPLLPVAPSVFGNVRLSYDLGDGLPTVGIASQWSGKRLADNVDNAWQLSVKPIYAPPMFDVRLTLSGAVPRVTNLHYRLSGDYALTPVSPYMVTPLPQAPNVTDAVPSNRVTVLGGLQYDFR